MKNLILAVTVVFGLSFSMQAQAHCGSCGKGEEKKSCAEECKEKGHECSHKEGKGHDHHGKDQAKSDKSCDGSKDCSHCSKKKKDAKKAEKPAA